MITILMSVSGFSFAQECAVESPLSVTKQISNLAKIGSSVEEEPCDENDLKCIDEYNEKNSILVVDLSKGCENLSKKEVKLKGLDCKTIPPFELKQKGEDGKEWRVRFHFGFTRTKYSKTDMDIKSSAMDVEIKGVQLQENARGYHYNPKNWKSLKDASKMIDEPTNTMAISFEKGKNNFYVTVFHPKNAVKLLYTKDSETGAYDFQAAPGKHGYQDSIPAGNNAIWIQNSHMNLTIQLGYGRQIELFGNKKSGKVIYTPKADIGVNYSTARSIHWIEGKPWDLHNHKTEVNGLSGSVGQRIEYKKGVLAVFVDQKVTYSKMNQGFLDGNVKYSLVSVPTTFGLAIDLFSKKKKD